jgi:multisubunit Na+/H+ antiporter MnhE subunit
MNRLVASIVLTLRFVHALIASGLQTTWVILRGARRHERLPPSGLVRIPIAPMSARGTALLACLVSLTPGTSVIEVDAQAHSLVLHLLDIDSAQATLDGIRRDFEPGLLAWFGPTAR